MKVDPKQQQQENEFSLGDPYNLNSLIFLFYPNSVTGILELHIIYIIQLHEWELIERGNK